MKIRFFKTGELNGSSHVKIPLRSSALIKLKIDDKYCFIRSILAKLHTCENNQPNSVSNYRQYFNQLNIEGFDFGNGFKYSDMHRFEKINNLSINIFELNFYQDQNKWEYISIPIETSKNGESINL